MIKDKRLRPNPKSPLEINDVLPTIGQIAMIAATLYRNLSDTSDKLAAKAMELWFSARKRIFTSLNESEIILQNIQLNKVTDEIFQSLESSLPMPDKFPLNRNEFLKKMNPKNKSRPDLLQREGKAYVRDVLRERFEREPTTDAINDAYGRWKPYLNATKVRLAAVDYEKWRRQHIKDSRRAAGVKSAANKKAAVKK
jgi:hypothetical protein